MDRSQLTEVEREIYDWLQAQYGPLPLYGYSPHNCETAQHPRDVDYHYRIKDDGTIIPGARWHNKTQEEK